MAKRVLVAEFGRAHGVKGEVRLISHTADPLAVVGYSPLESEDGARRFVIVSARPQGAFLVARVEGVATREAAEKLTLTKLFVPRERLAAGDLEPGEYLLADLIGLQAVTATGEVVGRVVGVPNYGAGDLIEIARPGIRETLLLPFADPFVPEVDIPGGRLVVVVPEERA